MLPSELIGQLDVYKTVSADQLEGGIGGNADIKTQTLDEMKLAFLVLGQLKVCTVSCQIQPTRVFQAL